jgi:hypothetical protein
MKVRYVPKADDKFASSLKEGGEYIVLEIHIAQEGAKYRLFEGEGKSPGMYPIHLFDIVSNKIPSSWITATGRTRGFYLAITPERWTERGFWENYFNQDPTAEKIFEEEKQKMFTEDRFVT